MVERWTRSRSAASSMVASMLGYRAGVRGERAPDQPGDEYGERFSETASDKGFRGVDVLLARVRVASSKSFGEVSTAWMRESPAVNRLCQPKNLEKYGLNRRLCDVVADWQLSIGVGK